MKFLDKFGGDIAIDLGTANVRVFVKGRGIVLCEPSVVTIDTTTDKVVKVGSEAAEMLGRPPENLSVIRPMKDGSISQYEVTLRMLQYFIRRASVKNLIPPRVMISVPAGINDIEERAIVDAAHDAGARKTFLIEEPVAASIGAGFNSDSPEGHMIVNIGGGVTQIAVISFGGIVTSEFMKIGGDRFDEAIMQYVSSRYKLLIGEKTAESIKMKIGMVYDHDETLEMEVKGRDLVKGMPKAIRMNSREMMEAMIDPMTAVLDAVNSVIEKTPPELVGDILRGGITLVGGGCRLGGLDKLMERVTGIPTRLAPDADKCVVLGTGKMLDTLGHVPDGVINISRDRRNKY